MSRNLMGLFQRPFMDRDGALPLSLPLSSLSFIPFPMAHFMDLSPLSLLSKSIDRGDEMRLSTLPAPLHDKVRTTDSIAASSVLMRGIHSYTGSDTCLSGGRETDRVAWQDVQLFPNAPKLIEDLPRRDGDPEGSKDWNSFEIHERRSRLLG